MGKSVKNGQFTSFEKSKLSTLLNQLKSILSTLNKGPNKDNKDTPSLETKFTQQQFDALIKLISILESIGLAFTKGKAPGLLDLRNFAGILAIKDIRKALSTTRYVIYGYVLKEKLPPIINACYSKAKKNHSNQFEKDFKELFTAALKEALAGLDKIIPRADALTYFSEIESIVTKYPMRNNGINADEFIKYFRKAFLKDEPTIELKVTHPAAYELMNQFFMLYSEIPKELEDLLSFLNPTALLSFSSIPGIPKISHIRGDTSDFTYDFGGSGAIDFEEQYRELVEKWLPSILSEQLVEYFQRYSDSLHVQSEQAKMSLISRFVKEENNLFTTKVDAILENPSEILKKENDSQTKDEYVIIQEDDSSLESAIEVLETKENQIKALAAEIASRDYHLPFNNLLKAHPELKGQSLHNSNLDTGYLDYPLPNKLLMEKRGAFHIYSVKEKLVQNAEKQQKRLQERLKEITDKKEGLILRYHQERNAQFSVALELLTKNMESPVAFIEVSASHDIELLKSKYETLQQLLVELEKKQVGLDNLQLNLNKLFTYPSILQIKVTAIYTDTHVKLNEAKPLLIGSQKLIEKQMRLISSYLDRASFASNHNDRLKVLREKQAQLEEKSRIEQELNAFVEEKNRESESEEKKQHDLNIQNFLNDIMGRKDIILRFRSFSQEQFHSVLTKEPQVALDWIQETYDEVEQLSKQEPLLLDKIEKLKKERQVLVACYKALEMLEKINNTSGLRLIIPALKKDPVDEILKLKVLEELVAIYKAQSKREALMKLLNVNSDIELRKLLSLEYIKTRQSEVNEQIIELEKIQLTHKNPSALDITKKTLVSIVQTHQKLTSKSENFSKEIEARLKNLDELNAVEVEVSLLKKINELFENNKTLIELTNSESVELEQIETELDKLVCKTELLKNSVANLAEQENYGAAFSVMSNQQLMIGQRIVALRKCLIAEKIRDINVASLPTDSARAQLIKLKAELEKLTRLEQSIDSSFVHIGKILTLLPESEQSINAAKKELNELLVAKRISCLKKIDEFLLNYQTELKQQQEELPKTFDTTKYQAQKQLVDEIKEHVGKIKPDDLDGLKSTLNTLMRDGEFVFTNLTNAEKEEKQFQDQLNSVEEALENIGAKITSRENIASAFNKESATYIKNRAKKYFIKDALSSQDALIREEFLQQIIGKMSEYVHTGASQPILEYIATERSKFSGLTMQSLINRLIVAIKELDNSVDHYHLEAHEEALLKLKSTSPNFQQAVNNLYQKIKEFKSYGRTIGKNEGDIAQTMADKLCKKIDLFILQQADKVSASEFQKLHTDFIECLHSHDDEMFKPHSLWSSFLVNIAKAILTVATALGVINSQSRTSPFTFFGKTSQVQHIQSLDEAISNVSLAVSA